jgi:acetate kinase
MTLQTWLDLGEAHGMALQDRIRPVETILAINSGSSSLKLTVFSVGDRLTEQRRASVDRIGLPGTRLSVSSADRRESSDVTAADAPAALGAAFDMFEREAPLGFAACGHRIVHGGTRYHDPVRISPEVIGELRALEPLDAIHMPPALTLIDAFSRRYPGVPQVACFDTAFHRTLPAVARAYPLPQTILDAGVRRYGFHGLSCESIMDALQSLDPDAIDGRVLIAHLGNGASITAVRSGESIETTMGFSPVGGLMMGTRCGDLDPSVVTFLARTGGRTPDALDRLLGREAGLLGVSQISSDMRDLLGRGDSQTARQAVELFCYLARKHIGALAAAAGGVDTLVFTGGIGEHAAAVRAEICAGLEFLGIRLDTNANATDASVIAATGSPITVRVMQTDEDRMIAKHTGTAIGLGTA